MKRVYWVYQIINGYAYGVYHTESRLKLTVVILLQIIRSKSLDFSVLTDE